MIPFPYQETGARFLAARRRGGLLDGCRVGKTIQGVMACDMVNAENVLVTCPGMARAGWGRTFEAASLLGRPVQIIEDAKQDFTPEGAVIVSMDGSRNADLFARIMRHDWAVLLADEPHFLKSTGSQRTNQILSRRGFASKAHRIWFLTATPLMKDPSDLWVMLRTVGAYKGTFTEFLDEFCDWVPTQYGPYVRKAKNTEKLKKLIAPYFLRRMWDDVKHEVTNNPTPDPGWHGWDLQLDPQDPDVKVVLDELRALEADPKIARMVQRHRNGEAVDWSSKSPMSALRSMLGAVKAPSVADRVASKLASKEWDKAVVFFHHQAAGAILSKRLAPFGALKVDGKTKPADREARRQKFWDRPDHKVFICQDNIARQAIDLSCAQHLVFSEFDWIPDNNYQASMRIQGPLQTRPPHIYVTTLKGSLDEGINAANRRRTQMFLSIL